MASELPVLIVGAGPTGLTLAIELARRGIDFRIVDEAKTHAQMTKASSIQPRTLEVFGDIGILNRVLEVGNTVWHTQVRGGAGGEKELMNLDGHDLDAPYPQIIGCGQYMLEPIMIDHVEELGGTVEREVKLTSVEETDGSPVVTLEHADGRSETVSPTYLIGCDGAHSTVREYVSPAEGGGVPGKTFDVHSMVSDSKVDWGGAAEKMRRDTLSIFFEGDATLVVIPLPEDHWDIIAPLPEGVDRKGETPSIEEVQEHVDRFIDSGARVTGINWATIFASQSREVDTSVNGRIVICGDAVHLSSPYGGVGMNTGIQDSHNLAWKLELLLAGRGRDVLLESYDYERHRVVKKNTLALSDQSQAMVTPGSKLGVEARKAGAMIGDWIGFGRKQTEEQSQLYLDYEGSPIIDEDQARPDLNPARTTPSERRAGVLAYRHFKKGPQAGHRAPDVDDIIDSSGEDARLFEILRGTKHVLLLFAGLGDDAEEKASEAADLAAEAQASYGDILDSYVVYKGDAVSASLQGRADSLLDPKGRLHETYGADVDALYVVRPDGYVGVRYKPMHLDGVTDYMSIIVT